MSGLFGIIFIAFAGGCAWDAWRERHEPDDAILSALMAGLCVIGAGVLVP